MEAVTTVKTWKDRFPLCPGSVENHDNTQEGAVLGESRGPPAPAAARRRCIGRYTGTEQAHIPSFQHCLNQRFCKWLLLAELVELMDGVKMLLYD